MSRVSRDLIHNPSASLHGQSMSILFESLRVGRDRANTSVRISQRIAVGSSVREAERIAVLADHGVEAEEREVGCGRE